MGDVVYSWVAHCDGDGFVIFDRIVKVGQGIYYTPYWEDDNAIDAHAYIKSIQEVVR